MSKYIRLNITTEGKTELQFVKDVLSEHLQQFGIYCDVRSVLTSREHKQRGGMTTYRKAKEDIVQWMKEQKTQNVRFSTMFDFYALPNDFPGYSDAQKLSDPYQKVKCIEEAFAKDINDHRFTPYIQLHEFEALLFTDIDMLLLEYEDRKVEVQNLKKQLLEQCNNNPELVNDKRETSPSHRIIQQIPEYQKVSSGSLIAELLSIEKIREKCSHFHEWVEKLEKL